jgi:hypothetical protein
MILFGLVIESIRLLLYASIKNTNSTWSSVFLPVLHLPAKTIKLESSYMRKPRTKFLTEKKLNY